MNIDGLGDRIIEDFYNYGYIKNFSDIYTLYKDKEELIELEGFGNKSVDNLLNAIEESKKNSLERLISAIGIEGIGSKTAKILAKRFGTLENIMKATYDELLTIQDIGPTLAYNINTYFKDEEKMNEIKKLIELGLNTKYNDTKLSDDERVSSKKFVITGSFDFISRDEIKKEIEDRGGSTSSSVSSKTDVVIVGTDPGKKYKDAVNLNIPIWTEKELKEFLNE